MVYFVRDRITGAIKIGLSNHPVRRFGHLQTANPHPLELLGSMPGDSRDEKRLHDQFSALRQRGEWFRADDSLIATIAQLLHLKILPHDHEERTPKRATPLVEFFRSQKVMEPELCASTSEAVGFAVSIYRLGLAGFIEPTRYQVMRWDERPGPGFHFWKWYLWERPQWHDTPQLAATAFIEGHREWERMKQVYRDAQSRGA